MTTTTLAPSIATSATGVLASLALATLLPSLAVSSANVALPTVATALHARFADVQWVTLAYLLATTTLIVGAGRLGDLIGRRRVLLGGIALFVAASAGGALAPGVGWLIATRAVQGAGAAAMLALTMAFVGSALPRSRAGSAMGLLGTMSAVGTALGPSLGGALIATLGWPAIFAVNVPLGALAFVMAWRCLPADRATRGTASFDLPGMAWLALTLAALALAMTRQPALLAVAALGLTGFVWTEKHAASPLVPLDRLSAPALGGGLAMNALVSAVMIATLVIAPFHLGGTLGLGAAAVGALMSVGPVVSALSGVPAGRLVDRFGTRNTTLLGLSAMAAGCVLIVVLPASLGAVAYVGPLVVVTPGYALFQAANNAAVMADVATQQRGVVSGLLTLSRNLGLIAGASALAAAYGWAGLRPGFAIAVAMLVVAVGLAKRAK
ncbi:MFS transporter [Roseateles sp. BYS78W]|uniref:MFS transporter n=1 Tax=Pelomonas candidula TaxID=3299025 RepID=A0ABW7HD41_9BURK